MKDSHSSKSDAFAVVVACIVGQVWSKLALVKKRGQLVKSMNRI